MDEKLKRILAIIGLGAMGIFSVSLVMYFINPSMLGGSVGVTALVSAAIGGCIFLFLYIKKEFPAQKQKALEKQKKQEEFEREMAEKAEQYAAAQAAAQATQPSENSNEEITQEGSEENKPSND